MEVLAVFPDFLRRAARSIRAMISDATVSAALSRRTFVIICQRLLLPEETMAIMMAGGNRGRECRLFHRA
jgi:hypothetical protein